MKSLKFAAFGICLSTVLLGGYWFFSRSTEAQKIARNQWEYSAITSVYSFNPQQYRQNKIYGMAAICYLQNTGCRQAEVKYELDYGIYLQERALQENPKSRTDASQKAAEIAFQKAVAQLGSEGWEIVSEPVTEFQYVNFEDYNKFDDKSILFERRDTKAIYFKRLKTQ